MVSEWRAEFECEVGRWYCVCSIHLNSSIEHDDTWLTCLSEWNIVWRVKILRSPSGVIKGRNPRVKLIGGIAFVRFITQNGATNNCIAVITSLKSFIKHVNT